MTEYCFTAHQLIYGYVETDDDSDEIGRNPDLHFKDKGSFASHTTQTWYEMDKPLISQYVHAGWKAGSMCTNRTLSPGLEPGFSA